MTVLLSDDFSGAAGLISGRVPGTSFEGEAWGGLGLLDGAGLLGPADFFGDTPTAATSSTVTYAFNAAHTNPMLDRAEVTFSWKAAADLALTGEGELPALVLQVYVDGVLGEAYVYATYDTGTALTSWFVKLRDSAAPVNITADLVAGATYTGDMTVTDGLQTLSFAGHTMTATTAASNSFGITEMQIGLYGLHALNSITVEYNSPSTPELIATLASPLGGVGGGVRVLGYSDFSAGVSPLEGGNSLMELVTPSGVVRVPISSWQATLQTAGANYVQCVVPACTPWQDDLDAATEFVIYRRAVLTTGLVIEYEMARAPLEQAQFDRGPERQTCTISGYSAGFAEDLDPPTTFDRPLAGVRSISSGGGMRVRCAVDWLLRPGHRALVDGGSFVVGYINYYAPTGFDSYMDVGSRA